MYDTMKNQTTNSLCSMKWCLNVFSGRDGKIFGRRWGVPIKSWDLHVVETEDKEC